jgi:hypothetical protein
VSWLASSQFTGHGVDAVPHQKIADTCDFVIGNIEQEMRGSRYLSLAEAGPARYFQHVMYHMTHHMMHHMTQLARSDPIPSKSPSNPHQTYVSNVNFDSPSLSLCYICKYTPMPSLPRLFLSHDIAPHVWLGRGPCAGRRTCAHRCVVPLSSSTR